MRIDELQHLEDVDRHDLVVAVGAREDTQVAHDLADPLAGLQRIGERRARRFQRLQHTRPDLAGVGERAIGGQRVERHADQLQIAGDDTERIVDLVGDARRQHADRRHPLGVAALHDRRLELARPLLDLALQFLDHRGARFGKLARRALAGRLQFAAHQLLAEAPVLVLELLAADLGADPRLEHLELSRLGQVVVGAGGQPFQHGAAVVESGQQDQRDIAHAGRRLDALAGLLAAHARHDQVHQDAIDRLHGQKLQRLLAGVSERHVVAFVAQRRGQLLQEGEAVVDGQNLAPDQAGHLFDRPLARSPQNGGDAGEDDLHVLVLAHERIGARIEGPQLGVAVVGAGEQQARDRPKRGVEAQAADERRSVHVGHDAIDDDQVRPPVGQHGHARLAARRGEHRVAGRAQRLAERLAEGRAVVDDEHALPVAVADPTGAQQRARLGQNVAGIVGLADVFVGAGLEAADAVLHLGLGRQHDDRRRDLPFAELLEQVDAVAVRQQHVEDDKADVARGQRRPRLGNRDARDRLDTGFLERLDEVHADRQAVVDDENGVAHHATACRSRSSATRAGPISPIGRTLCAAPSCTASRGMP